jgi:hypothetical protein
MTQPPDESLEYDPDEPELPALDELPKRMLAGEDPSGLILDLHDMVDALEPTDDEIAEGNRLGESIDIDDDTDSGLRGPNGERPRMAAPSSTMAAARELATALQDFGVKVSIELRADAQGSWRVAPFVRNLQHHTVSRPSNGMTPCLNLVKVGRSDLSGPLCNGYLGYDGVARIITMGYANHPGLGGPWSVAGFGTVPRDNGRPYIFGWEHEGGYAESWTGKYEFMHDVMARCGAAVLQWKGLPLEASGEHKTWAPGRKIDRLNYTTDSGRQRIAAVRGTSITPKDWLMALSDAEQNDLLARVKRIDDKLADANVNEKTIFAAMRDVHRALTEKKPAFVEGSTYEGDLDNYVRWTHAHGEVLRKEQVPELRQMLQDILDRLPAA